MRRMRSRSGSIRETLPPMRSRRTWPCSRKRCTQRQTLDVAVPNRRAAADALMPSSITAATARLRKSSPTGAAPPRPPQRARRRAPRSIHLRSSSLCSRTDAALVNPPRPRGLRERSNPNPIPRLSDGSGRPRQTAAKGGKSCNRNARPPARRPPRQTATNGRRRARTGLPPGAAGSRRKSRESGLRGCAGLSDPDHGPFGPSGMRMKHM